MKVSVQTLATIACPLVFVAALFLCNCTSSAGDQNLSGIPGTPASQATASPTPLDVAVDQYVAKEWERRYDELRNEIESHREKWASNGYKSYQFVAAKRIGGVSSPWNRSPVLIKVVDGEAISKELVSREDVSLMARTDGFEEFDTIDKLFTYMKAELDSGKMVKAKYDRTLNYPTDVSIMFNSSAHCCRGIAVSKLKPTEN